MNKSSKITLLLIGILFSIIVIITGGSIYQSLYLGNPMYTDNLADFRDIIRSEGWTVILSAINVATPWLCAIIFYYIINSVHFDRWWHWCFFLIITALTTAFIDYKYLYSAMNNLEPGLAFAYEDLINLLFIWDCLLGAIIFTIASFSCRWWSNNCRHTPFPQ